MTNLLLLTSRPLHRCLLAASALAAAGSLFVALSVTGGQAVADERPVAKLPLVGIWGAQSAIHARSYLLIASAKSWTELYLRHLGKDAAKHSDYYNAEGVPEIDFEQCMVVAVLQGDGMNSSGVRVESVTEEAERVLVRFDDRSYQTEGPGGGGQRVAAYGFFVLPRSKKPLVLEEDVQSMLGKPPEWKERARLEAPTGR